jgi:hypothetical protein
VIGDDGRHLAPADAQPVHAAAQRRDRRVGVQHRLRREAAHHQHQPRLQQFDLPQQERLAGRHLLRLRVAVARRTALQHVGDEHRPLRVRLPRAADRGQHVVEQAAGLADEGLAARVFLGPGRLADQHPRRRPAADAEDGVCARPAQLAGRAGGHRRLQLLPVHRRDRRRARCRRRALPGDRLRRDFPGRRGRGRLRAVAADPFRAELHRLPQRRPARIEAHRGLRPRFRSPVGSEAAPITATPA